MIFLQNHLLLLSGNDFERALFWLGNYYFKVLEKVKIREKEKYSFNFLQTIYITLQKIAMLLPKKIKFRIEKT
jgi:hypothetical protein